MDKRQLLSELEAVVATGFPLVLNGNGRCNAPLLVDWLVDTVFNSEDADPLVLQGHSPVVAGPPLPARLQSCFSTDLHSLDAVLADSKQPGPGAAATVHTKASLQQALRAAHQLKQDLHVIESTTFPCRTDLGWLQDTLGRQQQRQQQQPRAGTQPASPACLQQQVVRQDAPPQTARDSADTQQAGLVAADKSDSCVAAQQHEPVAQGLPCSHGPSGSSNMPAPGHAQASTSAAAVDQHQPTYVRCAACKRTVLRLKCAAHEANCAARRALASRQAAAVSAKVASAGRPATPPLSTTSGRSGGGTAAAAAGTRGGSSGGSKGKRGASNLNPNRSRSPAAAAGQGVAAAAGGAAATPAAAAAAAAAGAPGAPGAARGAPAGVVSLLMAHTGAGMPSATAAALVPGLRAKSAAAAGPLGPGLMVYSAGRPIGAGLTLAAAAADAGKPPLPKPSARAAAAAAAAGGPDAGGAGSNGLLAGYAAQQQPGLAAAIAPTTSEGLAGLMVPSLTHMHGHTPGLPAATFMQQNLAHYSAGAEAHGVLQDSAAAAAVGAGSPSPGIAGASSSTRPRAAPGASAAAGGAAAAYMAGGISGLTDHPAAVPHRRRPRSAQPTRRRRTRLDAIAGHWGQLVSGALVAAAAAASAATGHAQKRASDGTGAPAGKLHAAAGANGHPTRVPSCHHGSRQGSKDSSRSGSGAAPHKQGSSGGKPGAAKLRLRGQGNTAVKRSAAAAAAAAGIAAGGAAAGAGGRSSSGGGSGGWAQPSPGHGVSTRPRRNSGRGGKGDAEVPQQQQQQPAAQQQQPVTRQQRKQQQQQQQQQHAEALLLDTDLGDIPDDLLELGNDPLFGLPGSLQAQAAAGADRGSAVQQQQQSTQQQQQQQVVQQPYHQLQQQQQAAQAAGLGSMGFTASAQAGQLHASSTQHWLAGSSFLQQQQQQQQGLLQLPPASVAGVSAASSWVPQQTVQQQYMLVPQQHTPQMVLPAGFVPTAGAVPGPGAPASTATTTTSSMYATWGSQPQVQQQQQQQQQGSLNSAGVLQVGNRLGSLSDWLPATQQRQPHQQQALQQQQHQQQQVFAGMLPLQQQQQQPPPQLQVQQFQQQPNSQQQQQQQQIQQQSMLMHMQQMQAMEGAALLQQQQQQQKQQQQPQGQQAGLQPSLLSQQQQQQQQQQQKPSLFNGMIPTGHSFGTYSTLPQASMQQQQAPMQQQQQLALAAWQQHQQATMQHAATGAMVVHRMTAPQQQQTQQQQQQQQQGVTGVPMTPLPSPGVSPGMVAAPGMVPVSYSAATPALPGLQQQQQQQQQQQTQLTPGNASMRPQLLSSIMQGAQAFMDPPSSGATLQQLQASTGGPLQLQPPVSGARSHTTGHSFMVPGGAGGCPGWPAVSHAVSSTGGVAGSGGMKPAPGVFAAAPAGLFAGGAFPLMQQQQHMAAAPGVNS